MIGTGLIGGKSVGMLLARAILKKTDPRWNELLEAHDSFFIGSDVFYSFLVENGCWWLRQKQSDPKTFLDGVEEARRRILVGSFPDYIVKEFSEMLDYFGQSPIIVRSSSLLEDNYGNAFAGKYESVFCANQGPHHKRLEDFLSAVKTIYASTMSEKALRYRAQRGLLDERRANVAPRAARVRRPLRRLVLSRKSPASGCRATLMSGTRASTPRRASSAWSSAWARGRWTAPTTTTRESSR